MSPLCALAITPRASAEDSSFDYRFESYNEEDGRVDVLSHYFDIRQRFKIGSTLGVRLVMDSISGATPVGTYDRDDHDKWEFAEVDDERDAVSFVVEQEIGSHLLTFEYTRSEEIDYISNAYALGWKKGMFSKNTVLSAGIAFNDDTVVATPGTTILDDRDKDSVDLALGLSQIVSPDTVLDFNVTYGRSEGYLADPYRQISDTRTILVPIPGGGSIPVTDTFTYPENRPDTRDRLAFKVSGRHYIAQLDAGVLASWRFFTDGDGIASNTFDLSWCQQVTEKITVTPFVRFYQQSKADYYYPSLTGTDVQGNDRADGKPPYFSSDYRLAGLRSLTYGVALDYQPLSWLRLGVKLERYEMEGTSRDAPSVMFPSANVISVGVHATY
jgi:hypothetical protein